jgi:hypothetical protein
MDTYDIIVTAMIVSGLLLFVVPMLMDMAPLPVNGSYDLPYINVTVPCYDHAWNVIKDLKCYDKQYIYPESDPMYLIIGVFGLILFLTGLIFRAITDFNRK